MSFVEDVDFRNLYPIDAADKYHTTASSHNHFDDRRHPMAHQLDSPSRPPHFRPAVLATFASPSFANHRLPHMFFDTRPTMLDSFLTRPLEEVSPPGAASSVSTMGFSTTSSQASPSKSASPGTFMTATSTFQGHPNQYDLQEEQHFSNRVYHPTGLASTSDRSLQQLPPPSMRLGYQSWSSQQAAYEGNPLKPEHQRSQSSSSQLLGPAGQGSYYQGWTVSAVPRGDRFVEPNRRWTYSPSVLSFTSPLTGRTVSQMSAPSSSRAIMPIKGEDSEPFFPWMEYGSSPPSCSSVSMTAGSSAPPSATYPSAEFLCMSSSASNGTKSTYTPGLDVASTPSMNSLTPLRSPPKVVAYQARVREQRTAVLSILADMQAFFCSSSKDGSFAGASTITADASQRYSQARRTMDEATLRRAKKVLNAGSLATHCDQCRGSAAPSTFGGGNRNHSINGLMEHGFSTSPKFQGTPSSTANRRNMTQEEKILIRRRQQNDHKHRTRVKDIRNLNRFLDLSEVIMFALQEEKGQQRQQDFGLAASWQQQQGEVDSRTSHSTSAWWIEVATILSHHRTAWESLIGAEERLERFRDAGGQTCPLAAGGTGGTPSSSIGLGLNFPEGHDRSNTFAAPSSLPNYGRSSASATWNSYPQSMSSATTTTTTNATSPSKRPWSLNDLLQAVADWEGTSGGAGAGVGQYM